MTGVERVAIKVLPGGQVSRKDAAKFLGREPHTLAVWAMRGEGPAVRRNKGRCFYMLNELEAFMQGEGANTATA